MNVPKWPMINQANDRCLSIKMSEIISVLKTTTTNLSGHYLMSPLKWLKMAVAKIKMTGYYQNQVDPKWTSHTEIKMTRWYIGIFSLTAIFATFLSVNFAIFTKINGHFDCCTGFDRFRRSFWKLTFRSGVNYQSDPMSRSKLALK